jgi:hypothetical protein
MKASGMPRIVAIADPTSMNYTADAMISIKVASSTPKQLCASRRISEVVYILWVSVDTICSSRYPDSREFMGSSNASALTIPISPQSGDDRTRNVRTSFFETRTRLNACAAALQKRGT